MSFRRFVYWCALCGGWAALGGWALGRFFPEHDDVAGSGLKGLCLGLCIALALGLVDALWVLSLRQWVYAAPRVLICGVVGAGGGLLGGVVGQLLFNWHNLPLLLMLGWSLTGLMVGVSLGAFDFLSAWVRAEDGRGARRKLLRGGLGGLLGGLLGGYLDWKLRGLWSGVFPAEVGLLSPSATGFVALGLCIGLLIAVVQVILKDSWLLVEAGFRKGREVPLTREVLTIGRAESCDLGLFGDPAVDRLHARISRRGDEFVLSDAGSAGGTYVNDVRISGPTPLHSGDVIGIGGARLRFRERRRRSKGG
jgi:hypothetical protein